MLSRPRADAVPDGTSAHGPSGRDGARGAADAICWERSTIDASEDGYTVLRAIRDGDTIVDWLIVDANALVRERWAWIVGDIVGVTSSRLNGAADNSAFEDVYIRALETGERQVVEVELALPAGKGGWRRLIVTPIDADTVSAITRDISRERYMATALDRERKHELARASFLRGASADVGDRATLASRTAAALFLGSGVVALTNGVIGNLAHVNAGALRVTAVCSALFALLVLWLPWKQHYTTVANCIVVGTIAFLVVSDHYDHYSRSSAATAVYPVFFIALVAWTGLTRTRGVATVVAFLSAPALYGMLATAGQSVGMQCVIVTMPVSAVLGEVLSWNAHRARMLTKIEVQRRLHDPLTGLANRMMLSAQLDHALARVRRGLGAVAVLYIDVDHFKRINDTLGHAVGDDVLIATAETLRSTARESDTIARIGGDEFVIVCEDLDDVVAATDVAQRVLDALAGSSIAGSSINALSCSIGLAFSPRGEEDADTLLRNADLALYRAKQEGRGRFEVFGDALRHEFTVRRELEDALRSAVARDELSLHYQPIVSAADGTVTGFEALARWERPGYGSVSPGEFIPVAEESGLIVALGAWVLEHACREAASWATRWPDRRLGVSVNLSGHQVRTGDVAPVVRRALASSGLDARLLTLELTETTLIDNSSQTEPLLRELRDMGVNLAIDDFGTGYSSLTYLRRLPINIVKIDQSFVRAIGTDREDTVIVAAVLGLARNLRLNVVAEGVETPLQLATLVHLNCEHLQGFLFSRPVPAAEIAGVFASEPAWLYESVAHEDVA